MSNETPCCPNLAPKPSKLRRVVNGAKAAIRATAAGFEVVDVETRRRRLAACTRCREFYNSQEGLCHHPDCGCVVRIKSGLATEDCPIGNW